MNKEFKRRTKSMEIVAGEESAYRILAFVAMKMEIRGGRPRSGTQASESSSPRIFPTRKLTLPWLRELL